MSRPVLFSSVPPLTLVATPNKTGYGIVEDILVFLEKSKVLVTNNSLYVLLDKALCRYILNAGSGKSVYQAAKDIARLQGSEIGDAWYEDYFHFRSLHENDVAWVRVNRALHNAIAFGDVEEAAAKFGCDTAELAQLYNWYHTRVVNSPYLAKPDLSGNCRKCKACKEGQPCLKPDTSWWTGEVYDEASRYLDIARDVRSHCRNTLNKPGFKYLSDIYEDLGSLITELSERSWPAVLVTSHREDPTESLKMAKSYINRYIHHLAIKYTQEQKRQVENEETGTNEIQELGLLDDTEIDASKMGALAYFEEGYGEGEMSQTLAQYLSPAELKVVNVLMETEVDPGFEAFAEGRRDRRLAAFAYFKVPERQLRETLMPLLGRKPVETEDYNLEGPSAFKKSSKREAKKLVAA